MEWLSFIGSILGGLIAGIFTYLGVRFTIKNDRQKEERILSEKIEKEKPRLEIIKRTCIDDALASDDVYDCAALFITILGFKEINGRACFDYDEKALSKGNLTFVDYELKNTGLTEIADIILSTNLPKQTSLIDYNQKEMFISNKFLNYEVFSNKHYIKTNDTIKLRIYYLKEQYIGSSFGNPPITIWIRDINNNYWYQLLNAPYEEIEISNRSSFKHYKEYTDVEKGIECFRNPMLW